MPWKVLTLRAEAEDDDVLGRPLGACLNEDRLPAARRAELKQADPVIWEALYQQHSASYKGAFFDKKDVHHYRTLNVDLLNRYIIVDPANAKNSNSDYSAFFVFGMGEDRNYYWIRMVRDRLDPKERAAKLIQLHRTYKPIGVGYEEYGMQSDIFYIQQQMERLNYRFDITHLGNKGPHRGLSKQDRIRTLVPLFKTGQIWLPEQQHEQLADGQALDMIQVFLMEYTKYPRVAHDDMLDAMARITDPLMKLEYPLGEDHLPPPPSLAASGRTWMSS